MNDSTWLIREADIPSTNPDVLSTLFCVGNGQTTTRGTLSHERFGVYRGVYVSGLYTKAGWGLNYFMGGPDWLPAFVRGRSARGQRTLDLRTGILRVEGVGFVEERFASWARPNVMVQRITFATKDPVEVVLGLDGEVRQHLAKYYKPGQFPNSDETGLKLSAIETISAQAGRLHVALKSRSTEHRVSMTARITSVANEYRVEDGRALAVWKVTPGIHVFEKVCALNGEPPTGVDLWAEHKVAVAEFWKAADVEVDGDDAAQRAIRFAIWSTRIAAADDDGASSLGAKNLTGDWYRGAVFWDMEMYQLPMLAAVAPKLARNHVLYRSKRLGAAKVLAGQDGYAGARYPWQSYNTGLEEPPVMGGFLYMQQHINLAVAWGILHYRQLTGDNIGTEVLVELARFFASRVQDGHIHGVCGPDEIHASVTDNAYTNRLAIWLWQQMADESSVPASERAYWQQLAKRLTVPQGRNGLMLPYAGWEQMPEPNDALTAHDPAADKRCKQADLLMLFQALPLEFDDATVAAHWREYAPLCDQTSSLSLSTHALIAARLGLARDAEQFMRISNEIDLGDVMGNTCDGIHGAGQGGIWLAVVHGCGGLRVGRNRVVIAPNLPAKWASLRYRFFYHGQLIKVEVTPLGFTVENLGTLPVTINGQPLVPGKPVRVSQHAHRQEQGLQGVIFDLDGVLVTTDRYHYQAWKELADELGIPFGEERNHALRGVSREESLRRIYDQRPLPAPEVFAAQCDRKNKRYRELISQMTPKDVLPGALELLKALRAAGIKTAIASASKNAMTVLERTGLAPWLDAVSDGTNISANKPDPQVFYVAAQRLRLLPWNCVGVEDAASGIESIHRAGMAALGVGEAAPGADLTVARPIDITVELLQKLFREHRSPLDPYLERHAAKVAAERGASYAQSLTHGVKK
jgi:kojibiose phosphorylase